MQLLIQHFRHEITHRWSRPRSFMGTPQSTAGRCTMRAELPSMAFWCCLTQRSLGSHPKITCLGIVSIPKSPTWGGRFPPQMIYFGDCFHPTSTYLGSCSKNPSTPGPTSLQEGSDPTLGHPTALPPRQREDCGPKERHAMERGLQNLSHVIEQRNFGRSGHLPPGACSWGQAAVGTWWVQGRWVSQARSGTHPRGRGMCHWS